MIICVNECYGSRESDVFFINTDFAVSDLQKKYVKLVFEAVDSERINETTPECSISCEEEFEIGRLEISLPANVEAHCKLFVG